MIKVDLIQMDDCPAVSCAKSPKASLLIFRHFSAQKDTFKPLTGNGYFTFHNLCVELDTEKEPITASQNKTPKLEGKVRGEY